jgi:three-Cys-motif partner protein
VKHAILQYYLAPWARIRSVTRRPLAVVDGFAGRGRYQTGEPGSPLLILNTLAAHPDPSQLFVCHFVEKDPDNFASMVAEVKGHPAVISGRVRCYFYNAAFSDVSRKIIASIRVGGQPSFFFVDPFGYSDPAMGMVAEVLRLPGAEVFINLMFDFINRALNGDNPAVLDALVGSPAWRALRDLHGYERERAFIELYREQMKLRGADFVIPFRMNADNKDRTLYYLVHGSKHVRAATLMKDAMIASGSGADLGYNGESRHQMQPLFNMDALPLADFLFQTFADQVVTFDEIIARTIEESGACGVTQYRNAIKVLRSRGMVTLVEARTPTGKISVAITGTTQIRFYPF